MVSQLNESVVTSADGGNRLYANGQREKAQAVLMKYHGNGELTALVRLEMRQIGDSVATMPKRWDYGTLFKTRSARYRVMLGK